MKKRAFTLLEMLIVISIIIILGVVAVPTFDRYGAKSELSTKAEEINYYLERAYARALSPAKSSNGVEVLLTSDKISAVSGSYDLSGCAQGIAATGCIFEDDLSSADFVDMTSSTNQKITISNLKVDEVAFSDVKIKIISPVASGDVVICPIDATSTGTSLVYDCDLSNKEISFRLGYKGFQKDLIVSRFPFKVSIKNVE